MRRATSPGSGWPSTAASRCGRRCERRRIRELPHEASHVPEVRVARDVHGQIRSHRTEPEPSQRGLGEQEIRALPQVVLQELMREDHIGARDLAAPADQLAQEAPVMDDDLEIETADAPTGLARAALVGLQLTPPIPERATRLVQ